jgi:RND family efflux transporter MFP subunit
MMQLLKQFLVKKSILGVGIVLALGIIVIIGILWQQNQKKQIDATVQPSYQTAIVQKGDLSTTISGSGEIIANKTVELSFPIDGIVGKLYVQVGDKVKAGDKLAEMEETRELQIAVDTREIEWKTAKKELDELLQSGSTSLAEASLALAEAKEAFAKANSFLRRKGDRRCAEELTLSYYYDYLSAQKEYRKWVNYLNGNTGYGKDYILEHLEPQKLTRDLAYINWKYCEGYTEQEIRESEANYDLAKAKLEVAEKEYETQKENAGLDPYEIRLAEVKEENARNQLAAAQEDLEEAVLTAPLDSYVLSISGVEGDYVETGTFITLVDLDHPFLKISIDESDSQNVRVGCSAEATFDAIPEEIYNGLITQVSPLLVSVGQYGAVQTWAQLETPEGTNNRVLKIGLTASVDITCSQAENVLLIPTIALHKSDGKNIVHVLNSDGAIEEREVNIGKSNTNQTEIVSGLSEGERVITDGINVQ